MSRTIFLDPLRFHLEVKENPKGRFLKIADVSPDGKKNQISMTFAAANVFSENLVKMIDFYDGLHQLNPDNLKQGELKAEVMYQGDKKYHMDLKESARGRFLKVLRPSTKVLEDLLEIKYSFLQILRAKSSTILINL